MKNLLVCVDFNKEEILLIEKAHDLAKAFGAKIWLVHIVAPNPEFIGYEKGPQYIRDSRAEELRKEHRLVQDYANNLIGKGIEAEGLLIQGGHDRNDYRGSSKTKCRNDFGWAPRLWIFI